MRQNAIRITGKNRTVDRNTLTRDQPLPFEWDRTPLESQEKKHDWSRHPNLRSNMTESYLRRMKKTNLWPYLPLENRLQSRNAWSHARCDWSTRFWTQIFRYSSPPSTHSLRRCPCLEMSRKTEGRLDKGRKWWRLGSNAGPWLVERRVTRWRPCGRGMGRIQLL